MMVPAEYGGAGLDTVSYALVMEEISARLRVVRRDHERQQLALLRSGLKFGTDEQKKEYPRARRVRARSSAASASPSR